MMGKKWVQKFLPQTFYQPFPSGASEATPPEISMTREEDSFSFSLLRLPNSRDATRPSPSERWQKDGCQKEEIRGPDFLPPIFLPVKKTHRNLASYSLAPESKAA